MRNLSHLIFVPFFLSALPLSAVDQKTDDTYSETIVVTADRIEEPVKETGSAITVITREQIEQRKAPFVLDLLRGVPGIYISESGNVGKITSIFTRGAASDQTLVMVDGVQINDSTGFIDLSDLSTANIERIEIVRGPQSTLYGSDALGGVVNIITRQDNKLFSARAEGGSDSTFLGSVRGAFGTERNGLALEYDRFTTNGETENDDYDNRTLTGNARFQLTDSTNIGVIYRHADGELGIPFYFGVPSPDQRQENRHSLIHVPVHQKIQTWWDADFHFSSFDQEIHYRHPSDPFGFTFSDTDSRTTTANVVNTFKPGKDQTIVAGYEFERIRIDDQSTFGVALDNAIVENHAVYGQYQFSPRKDLTATAGLRMDHHNVFGTNTNPRVAVAYQMSTPVKLRGTVGTGFRAPRPGELGGPYGNAALQPEHVTSWDFGSDIIVVPRLLTASATVFSNRFSNMIGFDLSTFQFANFVKVKTSGLELEAGIQPLPNLNLTGSYTYLRTEDQATGLDLLRRPKNTGSINIGYHFGRVGVNYNWNLIGERFDINDTVFPAERIIDDAYNRADAIISYQLTPDIQIYGKVLNVFNQTYQEVFGYAAPDRGVLLGIKLY